MFHPNLRRRRGAVFFLLAATAHTLLSLRPVHAQTPAAPPSAAQTAPGDTLSIGPGVFTFEQIAALLSTPQTPIACDVGLKDRAAYVFLRSRPRAQAKEILGAGLQVEFDRDEKTKGVTMARQKAVAAREAQWLKRLARVLQTEWQKKLQETASLSRQPFIDFDKRHRLQEKISSLHNAVGDPPFDTPPATEAIARQRAERLRLDALLDADNRQPTAQQRMLGAWAQENPPDFVSLLQGRPAEFAAQPISPQFAANGWAKQALFENIKQYMGHYSGKATDALPEGFNPPDYQWSANYGFEWNSDLTIHFSARGFMAHQPSAISQAALARLGRDRETLSDADKQNATVLYFLNNGPIDARLDLRFPNETVFVPERIPAPLFMAGQEAVDWWKAEQTDTDRCIKSLPNTIPAPLVAISLPPPKTTWEIVMELHPRAELWQKGDADAAVPLAAWTHPARGAEQWSVREKENVLLITNRLAFIERPQSFPLAEWVRLSGELRAWHEKNDTVLEARFGKAEQRNRAFIDRYTPYEPLANYARAVTARRDGRTWRALGYPYYRFGYHGAFLYPLDDAVPAVFLWGKLPEKERAKFLTRVETPSVDTEGRALKVPLSHFSGATLITLAQMLRERGWTEADAQNPEFMGYLRSCFFYAVVYVDPKGTLPGCHAVRASLLFDPARSPRDVQIDAPFLVGNPSEKTVAPLSQTP